MRSEAYSLGANLFGIAPARLPIIREGGTDDYRHWVAAGMHAGMAYMSKDADGRADIARWFPAAKSVVLCAFSYHDGGPAPTPEPGRGRMARYCLPADYHDALRERMQRLLDRYKEAAPGGHGKIFVDSSPVLERLYARLAGIGWVGKNSMIVSPKIGSFFVLAGLALDAELPCDRPVPDRCGSCERCLKACPAQAFPRPRVLDSSRCVAYFTVEHRRSPIPLEMRAAHGDRVFGCDACQDACPWNRFSAPAAVLKPRMQPSQPLEELASLSQQEFELRFQDTPVLRTGRAALARNALLCMGNSGDGRHRATLERLAADPDPMLAEQAAWSLEIIE